MKNRLIDGLIWCADPVRQLVFQVTNTAIWFVMIPVSIFTDLKKSIVFVVMCSVWANFASHGAGAIAAYADKFQREQADGANEQASTPPERCRRLRRIGDRRRGIRRAVPRWVRRASLGHQGQVDRDV